MIIQRIIFTLILSLIFSACFEAEKFKSVDNNALTDSINNIEPSKKIVIESIELEYGEKLHLAVGQVKSLDLQVRLSDGIIYSAKETFKNPYPYLNGTVVWYSNNNQVAAINSQGVLEAKKVGTTTILTSLQNKSTMLYLEVFAQEPVIKTPDDIASTDGDGGLSANNNDSSNSTTDSNNDSDGTENNTYENVTELLVPEEPLYPSDLFLNQNDIINTEKITENGGYGIDDFPDILFGPPVDVYDVLSLGSGGELKIQLNGFIIVNGEGSDFTIFENAFPEWQECAEISVSFDDIHYFTFDCDQYSANTIYKGCAGVHSVNYGLKDTDYLNPLLSGGDSFDLSDLQDKPTNIDKVKFIKIKDIGLCETSSIPALTKQPNGFDFDAMAIIYGINE